MISDEKMRKKIKRHYKRKTRNHVRYYANGFGKDFIIWRSLCAFYIQERVEKENHRYLGVRDMIWLLAMKQYLVETGADSFYITDIKRFLNYNFKQNKSGRTAMVVFDNLLKSGFIIKEGLGGRKIVLTMKARAFYRDLEDLLSI